MTFWWTVAAGVVVAFLAWAANFFYRWFRERFKHDFQLRAIKSDLDDSLTWWDRRAHAVVTTDENEIRVELVFREPVTVSRINARFVRYKYQSEYPSDDRVPSDLIEVFAVRDHYWENGTYAARGKSPAQGITTQDDGEGGIDCIYHGPVHFVGRDRTYLRVIAVAKQKWQGYLSIRLNTNHYARLRVSADPTPNS